MEKYILQDDLKVFGVQVKTFPSGIDEAFYELIKKTDDCADERNYYGVSSMDHEGKIIYKAVAEEKHTGEAKKFNYEQTTIEKGEYFFTILKDWSRNKHCIKDIFHEMMKDGRVDKTKPCVEWYKNDNEMLCMVKAK
jgi:predicted transcriptional regulator YdeE